MNQQISRRDLLGRGAALAGTAFASQWLAPGCSKPQQAQAPATPPAPLERARPSNRITIGMIGMGEEGTEKNLEAFLRQPDAQVVAVCDVDGYRMRGARLRTDAAYAEDTKRGAYSGCMATKDWREIIARDDIDAVAIATPDHWHVPIAAAAARAGKDIFCEKPLSLTIAEGRFLSDVVTKYGRILQTATEYRTASAVYDAVRLARSGLLGKLHSIHVHVFRGFGETEETPDAMQIVEEPVPPDFDYDMWLGPAPFAPYMKHRCHSAFRYILDYSGGNITDWGAHMLDIAQWGNDTEHTGPVSVEGKGTFPQSGLYNVATDFDVKYGFENGVTMYLKSGGCHVRFEGTDGWVQTTFDSVEASSPDLLNQIFSRMVPGVVPHGEGEHRNFLDCVMTRQIPYLPVEIAHRSISLGHLANIAIMTGRKLKWDAEAERFPEDDAANRYLSRAMRSPWRLEA